MAEFITFNKEFEHKPNREIERKFLPLFPERLNEFLEYAVPIEQIYLSHPSEPYSLRLRQTEQNGQAVFMATLKDTGNITTDGLDRLEVETEISQEAYEYYHSPELPVIKKLRADMGHGVVIDWFEDGYVHVESEHPGGWNTFTNRFENQFVDITGDKQADNEWRAHYLHRLANNGREALVSPPKLNLDGIVGTLLSSRSNGVSVVRVNGRSGSGKSTIVQELQDRLRAYDMTTAVLSTDDYNRGKKYLDDLVGGQWTDWDHPYTYDTTEASKDIERLLQGTTIGRQRFDFETQEPTIDGVIESADIIIVEGIYTKAPEIVRLAPLALTVPTPLATSIGRRLKRDFGTESRANASLPTPQHTLRYILEKAEPAYRTQTA